MRELHIILFISLLGFALATPPTHPTHTPGCSLQLDGNSRLHVHRFVEGRRSWNNSVQFNVEQGSFDAWIKPSPSYVHDTGFILQSGFISTNTSEVAYELSYQFKDGYVQADFWKLADQGWSSNTKVFYLSVQNEHWVHVSVHLAHQLLLVNGSAGIETQDIAVTRQAPHHRFSIGRNFTGLIDEVRIWRNTPVRGAHMRCANTEDLVLFLSFDECGGNATADHSSSLACARVGPAVHRKGNYHKQDGGHDNDNNKDDWKGHGSKYGNDQDGDYNDGDREKHADDHDDDDHKNNGENGRYNKHDGERDHKDGRSRDEKHRGSGKKHPAPFILTNSTTRTGENRKNYHKQRGADGERDHGREHDRDHGHRRHRHEFTPMAYGPQVPQSHVTCTIEKQMTNVAEQCPYRNRKHGEHNEYRHGGHRSCKLTHGNGVSIIFLVTAFAACFCCVRCCRSMRRRAAAENRGFVSLHPANTSINAGDSDAYPGNVYYPAGAELDQQPLLFDGSQLYNPQQIGDAQPQMWDPRMMGGYVYYMPQAQMTTPISQDGEQGSTN